MDAREIRRLRSELMEYLGRFDDCFGRRDTRAHLSTYVEGLLSGVERKSVEPIALGAGVPPRTLQNFLSVLNWDHDRMRDRVIAIVASDHPHPCAVGIFDETSDDKKGNKTPGVKRQWCGSTGKVDNCVVTVHLGYATPTFRCLLDGQLYLPEDWGSDRARCRAAGIPDTLLYQPKWQIGLQLYDRARAGGVTLRWVTFDEAYGGKPNFLAGLDARQQAYIGEVPKSLVGWITAPQTTQRPYRHGGRGRPRQTPRIKAGETPARSVEHHLRHSPVLRDQAWQRYRVADGEKGAMVWEVKETVLIPKDAAGLPQARPLRLVIARNRLNPELVEKYFVSNDQDTPLTTLLLVAFSRWKVERCFEDMKGEVGLDHYEGRRYMGLMRHITLATVSMLFLARVHEKLRGKKPGVDDQPGTYRYDRVGAMLVA